MDYSKRIKKWEDFDIGDVESFAKTITDADIVVWCGLTGDLNPIHLDRVYSERTRFKDVIVPGVYVLGFVSAAVSRLTLGHVYAQQNIRFKKPVFAGDTITATAEVIEKLETKNLLRLKTTCVNQNGDTVMEGEALQYVLMEKEKTA